MIIQIFEKKTETWAKYKVTNQTTIGRSINCDIVIPDNSISSEHAIIALKDGQHIIYDNESTNGIIHNGNKTNSLVIESECEIHLGDIKILLHPIETLDKTCVIDLKSITEDKHSFKNIFLNKEKWIGTLLLLTYIGVLLAWHRLSSPYYESDKLLSFLAPLFSVVVALAITLSIVAKVMVHEFRYTKILKRVVLCAIAVTLCEVSNSLLSFGYINGFIGEIFFELVEIVITVLAFTWLAMAITNTTRKHALIYSTLVAVGLIGVNALFSSVESKKIEYRSFRGSIAHPTLILSKVQSAETLFSEQFKSDILELETYKLERIQEHKNL